jgi:hypothetical protein
LRPFSSKRQSRARPCGIRHDVFIHVPSGAKSMKKMGNVQILA